MDDPTFDRDFESVLAALRAHRGECPELDGLIDVDLSELSDDEREQLERHLDLCPTCAGILRPESEDDVDDIAWRRAERSLDARDKPWLGARGSRTTSIRPLLAVAASLLVALGGFGLWQQLRRPTEEPPAVSTTRGTAIQLIAPVGAVGAVDAVEVMRWRTALPLSLRYRAEVQREERLVWQGETDDTQMSPSADLLDALDVGGAFRWRIVGLDDQGSVVVESDWVEFEIER